MQKTTNINYAKKLRFLRTTVGVKQATMANKLNISQQAYSVLENGKTHFTDKLIRSICVIFSTLEIRIARRRQNPREGKNISRSP